MMIKSKKVIPVTLVIILTVVLLAGCGQDGKKMGEVTVIDLAGREVTLNVPVEKAVLQWSGSGGGFLTLVALEGKEAYKKIAGWDPGLKTNRHWEWMKFSEAIPELENLPDIGNIATETFSIESVIALKPEVIILPLNLFKQAEEIVEKLEKAGISTIVIDFHEQKLENHINSIQLMGTIFGKEKRAHELVDFYQEQVDVVYSRLETIDKPKPKVYVEGGFEEYFSYGNAMWGALVKQCGGINIGEGVIETWGQISPEYVLSQNPDIIIVTGSYWPNNPEALNLGYYADLEESKNTLLSYTKRPGWENLNAVKNNRIYGIHHILSRDIHDSASTQFFAKIFYPEEFKDIDPVESFREFHKRFLPIEYSGVFMMSLD